MCVVCNLADTTIYINKGRKFEICGKCLLKNDSRYLQMFELRYIKGTIVCKQCSKKSLYSLERECGMCSNCYYNKMVDSTFYPIHRIGGPHCYICNNNCNKILIVEDIEIESIVFIMCSNCFDNVNNERKSQDKQLLIKVKFIDYNCMFCD
jgi:hypothetical protein